MTTSVIYTAIQTVTLPQYVGYDRRYLHDKTSVYEKEIVLDQYDAEVEKLFSGPGKVDGFEEAGFSDDTPVVFVGFNRNEAVDSSVPKEDIPMISDDSDSTSSVITDFDVNSQDGWNSDSSFGEVDSSVAEYRVGGNVSSWELYHHILLVNAYIFDEVQNTYNQ